MGNSHTSLGLSREEEHRAKMRFSRVTSKEQPFLEKKKFTDLLGNPTYADGLFNLIDTDGNGSVSSEEICKGIELFRTSRSAGSKLRVLFSYYDLDYDGRLSQSEIADAMRVACGQDLSDSQLEKLAHSVMEAFDVDKDGFLSFKEFCCLMRSAGLQHNL